MHDDVGTEGERLLEVARREGVVDDEDRPGGVGDVGDGADVGDAEQGVARGLDPDEPRDAGADRGLDRVDVVDRGDRVLDARRSGHLGEVAVGAAVGVRRDDGVVAGPQQGPHDGVLAGEARREREAASAALEGGEALLEGRPGGVGRARVLVAAAEPADAVLLVGGDLVDRRHDGTGRRVGLLPGVDGAGGETVVAARGAHGPQAIAAGPAAVSAP